MKKMSSESVNRSVKSPISQIEFAVLKLLRDRVVQDRQLQEQPVKNFNLTGKTTVEVSDIASGTGIRDREEALRALYTLEGKNLVQPEPAGDFTSHHWIITDTGVKALNVLRP